MREASLQETLPSTFTLHKGRTKTKPHRMTVFSERLSIEFFRKVLYILHIVKDSQGQIGG
ncbi:hypothetical protein B4U37_00495 [Sutcliffiella horikoshii]|uniref:Uncharacterized protein n=1 Tax=Sutcliffiella horikoshii TaxID=79883 RepID=A0ABM6KDT7_9BACI|nr:hypothetical protein B4U37_00495 [Sutcliffiella horikoshii]